jgi:hypothetical protein
MLLSRLAPYVDEIIVDHQYGFQCNRSATSFLHVSGTGEKVGMQLSFAVSLLAHGDYSYTWPYLIPIFCDFSHFSDFS